MLLLRLLLALALLLAGCAAGRSQFVPGEPSKDDAIHLAAPAETVVLIYNHGSEQKFIPAILADRFAALRVPRRQICLAGHSAGAWASLLVAREGPGWFNAVVAFGSAFAGLRATRPPGWGWLRGTQILYLSAATRIEALIFAFEGDPYEPPEGLAFLRCIPGVELVVLSGTRIDGVSCGGRSPHLTDRKPCFHATQGAPHPGLHRAAAPGG